MKHLFDQSSLQCSELVTKKYSTSFSLGIKLFAPSIRPSIYAIYGFVRYADEIVDTFHEYPQETLFREFETEYHKAIVRGISLNPILNAFQDVVIRFDLYDLVDAFMESMRADLSKTEYRSVKEYEDYIYGSADVVGLMCLKVFVKGNEPQYKKLKPYARKLGSAFQKVNFLRDIKDDFEVLGRSYFPNVNHREFNCETKEEIINDIAIDFQEAYKGILMLPMECKLGVYLAYRYYLCLLNKLKRKNSQEILRSRTRVSDPMKAVLLFKSFVRYKVNMI